MYVGQKEFTPGGGIAVPKGSKVQSMRSIS